MGRPTTRRAILQGVAATAALSAAGRTVRAEPRGDWDTIVVGAGVFGAWTAWHLRRAGQRVLLLDASGPANARASSGGESRMTRTIYGADDVYTRMAWDSLEDWRWLSSRAGLPIFHPIGVLMFFGKREPFVDQSLEVHRRLGLRLDVLDRAGAAAALSAGRLGRRRGRACSSRTSACSWRAAPCRRWCRSSWPPAASIGWRPCAPPGDGADARRRCARARGETLRAERYVFACGPWLPKVFPSLLGTRIFPTRQEVFFFAPEAATTASSRRACPAGPTSTTATSTTACPTSRAAASRSPTTSTAPRFDPDTGDRQASAGRARRRPRLPGAALPGARRAPARRGARLPVREQLERRPADRPPSALAERAAGRRRLRPRLQARARGRPLRRGPR